MTKQQAKEISLDYLKNITKQGWSDLVDRMYERECDNCRHYLSDNVNYPIEPCSSCSRFYADGYERD